MLSALCDDPPAADADAAVETERPEDGAVLA